LADSARGIADVDGDGIPEVIVIGNVYNCATHTSVYRMPSSSSVTAHAGAEAASTGP